MSTFVPIIECHSIIRRCFHTGQMPCSFMRLTNIEAIQSNMRFNLIRSYYSSRDKYVNSGEARNGENGDLMRQHRRRYSNFDVNVSQIGFDISQNHLLRSRRNQYHYSWDHVGDDRCTTIADRTRKQQFAAAASAAKAKTKGVTQSKKSSSQFGKGQQKAKSRGSRNRSGSDEKFDKTTEMCLRMIRGERPPKEQTKMSEEERQEGARLAKEYTRNWLLKRRSLMSSLHLKCHLRDMAIAALPSELQQHARTNDYTAFPKNRELPKEFIAIDEDDSNNNDDLEDFGIRKSRSR